MAAQAIQATGDDAPGYVWIVWDTLPPGSDTRSREGTSQGELAGTRSYPGIRVSQMAALVPGPRMGIRDSTRYGEAVTRRSFCVFYV